MTDRYEQFKEWIKKSEYGFWKVNKDRGVPYTAQEVINHNDVFNLFEETLNAKDREKEVKGVMMSYLPVAHSIAGTEYHESCVEVCYNELKRRGLLK